MAQYRAGKASVTNGSATVSGSGTFWLANISQGDAFTVAGSNVIYDVASVQSDTQLTLSTPYSGTSVTDATYAITRDFTSPDNFPELVSGDIETPTILTRAIRKIQQKFNTISDIGFSEAVRLTNQATLDMDFSNNQYKVYQGLATGMSEVSFGSLLTYTRGSVANAHNALGDISSVAIDEPRFSGNREGILIEYGRTNLVLWSEDFTQTEWVKSEASITTGQDPDSPADRLGENSASGSHSVSQDVSTTSGETYPFSVLLKADGRNKITMEQSGDYDSNVFQFDLESGEIISQGDARNYIKNVGDGWWVCVAITNASATGTGTNTVELNNSSGDRSYAGDGSSGVFIWGAQVESGDTASSYIKTEGTQASRDADQLTRTFVDEVNITSGTIYADVELGSFVDGGGSDNKVFEISNGTATGRITVRTIAGGSVQADVDFGGNTYTASVPNTKKDLKIAISYTRDVVMVSTNGVVEVQSTTTRAENFSELRIGHSVQAGSMIGTFSKVWYLPVALSATDLANATA